MGSSEAAHAEDIAAASDACPAALLDSRFVPGPIRRALTEGVMRTSVRELKARVEDP